jgi:hypothetical protein
LDGKTVYQESQTFNRKQFAQAWGKRCDSDLVAGSRAILIARAARV